MLVAVTAVNLLASGLFAQMQGTALRRQLAPITNRGRDLAGYDVTAWHDSDPGH
jgi:hypothetical protein